MPDCRCLYWTSLFSLCFLCDISAQLWGHILITSYTTRLSLRAISIFSIWSINVFCMFAMWNTHVVVNPRRALWPKHEPKRHRERVREGNGRNRLLVEPIRRWPHLFATRLLTIYLWLAAAEQLCGNGWDAVELFCRVSHETFHRRSNTPRPWRPRVPSNVKWKILGTVADRLHFANLW